MPLKCTTCLRYLLAAIPILLLAALVVLESVAGNSDYQLTSGPDGTYIVNVCFVKRHWEPFTAEGFCSVERESYSVEIAGKERLWGRRGQNGYYYSLDEVKCVPESWDLGYAWIDSERKYLYLNFYWVSSPDNIIPSDVNGKYRLAD